MNQEQEHQDEQDQRERNLSIVREGWKSDYWIILRDKLKEWIRDEESYLDSFKSKGMRGDFIDEYNRSRDRIDFMLKFLNVNQTIIAENETILARLKSLMRNFTRKVQSFVTK